MHRILVAVLTVVVAVAACGGDDGGPADTSATVVMEDIAFEPAAVTVPAGAAVTLDLRNQGTLEHQWVILDSGVEVTSEDELPDDSEILSWDSTLWGEQLLGGQGGTFTFSAPAAGIYQIVCGMPGHMTAGMEGELIVTE